MLFASIITGVRDNDSSDESNDETILYEHDTEPTISINKDNITILYTLNDTIYTQRCIEDRISNPHGEHAENVWLVAREIMRQLVLDKDFILYKGDGH